MSRISKLYLHRCGDSCLVRHCERQAVVLITEMVFVTDAVMWHRSSLFRVDAHAPWVLGTLTADCSQFTATPLTRNCLDHSYASSHA